MLSVPHGCVKHNYATYSDHCPISWDMEGRAIRSVGTKPFWFETMWVGENTCSNIIEQIWSELERGASIERCLKLDETCGAKPQ